MTILTNRNCSIYRFFEARIVQILTSFGHIFSRRSITDSHHFNGIFQPTRLVGTLVIFIIIWKAEIGGCGPTVGLRRHGVNS